VATLRPTGPSHRLLAAAAAFVALVVVPGCALTPVDLEGKACPCVEGYVCDSVTSRCRRESGLDATVRDAGPAGGEGGLDAGVDAGSLDAGSRDGGTLDGGGFDAGSDSGPRDSGPRDSGPRDSGPRDSGPRDSGPRDSGPRDSGPRDSGPPDPTACDDILAGALFCDGFEGGLTAWGGSVLDRGTVTAVPTSYRGSGSLRARTTATGAFAHVWVDALGSRSSGDLYLRAYVRVPSGIAFEPDGVDVFRLRQGRAPWNGVAFGIQNGDRPYVAVDPAGMSWAGTAAFPRDAWVCVQLHVTISNTAGAAELWVSRVPTVSRTGLDTLPSSAYVTLTAGIDWSGPSQTSAEVLVDEVAVGTAMLPCDP